MAEQAGSGSALKGPAWCGGGGSSCVGGREGHQGLGGVQQSRVAAGSASKGDCRGPEGLGLGWWGVGRGHAFQRPLWTRARGRDTRRDVRWRERQRPPKAFIFSRRGGAREDDARATRLLLDCPTCAWRFMAHCSLLPRCQCCAAGGWGKQNPPLLRCPPPAGSDAQQARCAEPVATAAIVKGSLDSLRVPYCADVAGAA